MEKLKKFLYKGVMIILFVFALYVTYSSIYNIQSAQKYLQPSVITLGTIVMIFTFIALKKIISKISEKMSNIIAIIICILFFIGISIFGCSMISIPTYDLSFIQREAMTMMENGGKIVSEGYFAMYRSQIPMTIFTYFIYTLGEFLKFSNLRAFATIIDALFISITALFTYLSVKELKNYKMALLTLIFFVINPIFYLYSSYFYTDTFCMPFAAISIYLFIRGMKSNNELKKIICLVFSGLILAIGFEVRVTVGILIIGMIIGIWLNDKLRKKSIINIVSLMSGFLIGMLIYTLISSPFTIEKNDKLYFPTTNWILYGLNESNGGKWSEGDWSYTFTGGKSTEVFESDIFNEDEDAIEMNATYSEKQSADINKIKKRLKEMGLKGWLIFAKTKLNITWSNGDYDYVSKLSNNENINKMYEYVVGNRKVFILYYCQICKATMLTLFAVAVSKEIINPEKEKLYKFIYISIFGAFLFYLIWEVLSRYSLTFLPWMMLVFEIGITQIEKFINIKNIKIKLKDDKNINFNMYKIIRKVSICTLVISTFLLIVNFHDCSIKKRTYWDKKVTQFRETGDKLNIISNKVIEQTFKTSGTFNSIAIKMKKNTKNVKSITHYNFVLSDINGNILKNIEFTSDDVKNDFYKTFKVGKIRPEGNQEYKIRIYSTDATDDNSIGIASCYIEGYSVYPDGKMTVNGEVFDADLTFKVQKENKRTHIPKKWFIVMSIFIIGIEIFAFYPYLCKKDEYKYKLITEKKEEISV